MESCPNCLQSLPNTEVELIAEVEIRLHGWHSEHDLFYCPNCDTDLSTYWHFEDLIWYDKTTAEEFSNDGDSTMFYVCCDSWGDDCDCKNPVSFDYFIEKLESKNYDVRDLYYQDKDVGMDCTSCKLIGTQDCPSLLAGIAGIRDHTSQMPMNIEPCQEYQYSSADMLKYDFKDMTAQAIKVRYPVILGKKKVNA